MIRLRGWGNVLWSKLGMAKSLQAAADHIEIIEPELTETAPALHILPDMLDRVSGDVAGVTTAEKELATARATHFIHAPVKRYLLSDCFIHRGGVEYRGGRIIKNSEFRNKLSMEPISRMEKATYCMSHNSHMYFGHWLRDACATAMLCADQEEVILDERPDWPDVAHYADFFGLKLRSPGAIRVAELDIYSDFAQGASKRRRYSMLRARLRQAFDDMPQRGSMLYLRRGQTGSRRVIVNEDLICEVLVKEGFEIVDLATESFEERCRKLAAADLVVSVEGSHANHAFFALRPGATFISIIPCDRFVMIQRGISNAFGLNYGCVVVNKADGGYFLEISELLRTLELAGRGAAASQPAL